MIPSLANDDTDLELTRLTALVRERHGAALHSLLLFGSCLSARLQRPGSIPDMFALVDNLPSALVREGLGALAGMAARVLPPTTLALRVPWRRGTAAKLNLITPAQLRLQLRAAPDLYLAGRLGKHTRVLWARDPASRRELEQLLDSAATRIVDSVLDGLPERCELEAAVRRCVTLSYEAEVRPETAARIAASFRVFASEYAARYRPLLLRRAQERGLRVEGECLIDARTKAVALRERRRFHALLHISRLRSIARWPKQALVYRGSLPYLLGKLRRARSR
jgi:hypothetical protein